MTPTRYDWLSWRREGVGASDVAAIIGISPWASPWSVWADKSGLLPPEPENEYMTAGRFLEAAIGPWFMSETGLVVAGEQTWCSHPLHVTHRCTVDGFVFDGPPDDIEDALGCFEVKVTGPGRRWDHIPEHYQAQGQWQMHVTGMERVWFAVLMGRRLDIHELERDQADIEFMSQRIDAFWTDHVLAGTPPDTDGSDATARALAAVYPKEQPGEVVVLDRAGWDQYRTWMIAKGALAGVTRDAKAQDNAIRALLGDAESATHDGETVITLRAQTRRSTCKHCNHVTESEPFRVLRPVRTKESK